MKSMENYHCITYVSEANCSIGPSEMESILTVARSTNRQMEITGVLVFQSDHFLQVIEGAEDNLRPLYERIRNDQRHKNIITILDHGIEARQFGDWSMAHVEFTPEDELNGFSRLLMSGSPKQRANDFPFIMEYINMLGKYVEENYRKEELVSEANEMLSHATEQKLTAERNRRNMDLVNHLTRREREVMEWVIGGATNKQVAYELNAAETTIKIHRGRIMSKMEVGSIAELVRTCERLGIAPKVSGN